VREHPPTRSRSDSRATRDLDKCYGTLVIGPLQFRPWQRNDVRRTSASYSSLCLLFRAD